MLFSAYKGRTTLKAIVCVSPCGTLTFVNDLFGGSISDHDIVHQSGLLSLFEQGDKILVERAVNILQECTDHQLKLVVPAFLNGHPTFTAVDTTQSRQVR